MSEMVNRVGGAILAEARAQDMMFNARDAEPLALAAIKAMRGPTPEMGRAGYSAWDAFGEDAVMGPKELIAVWEAMIDAALAEL